MPNWTYCMLEAPKAVIEKYLSKDEDGDLYFDFNKVIPRPDIYQDPDMSEGGDTTLCLYWYLSARGKISPREIFIRFGNIFSNDEWYFNDPVMIERILRDCNNHSEEYYRRGEKYFTAYKSYGYRSWYTWSIDNWGTKWNACETHVSYDDNDFGVVHFDTAWSYPEPIIDKIFEDNPNCVINFSWYDEDYNGHHGIGRNEHGVWTRWEDWDPEVFEDTDNEG